MRPEFGADLTNVIRRQSQIVQMRMAGQAVIRVVGRCNTAQENNELNLSNCQLRQVPDAVYHLMREVKLTRCDLSGNDISKISKKFAQKFPCITELDLSHNKISTLPDELVDCRELQTVDISHNSFVTIPTVLLQLPKIKTIRMSHNFIMDADACTIPEGCPLQEVFFESNPLTDSSYDFLNSVTEIKVHLSPKEKTEWDDL